MPYTRPARQWDPSALKRYSRKCSRQRQGNNYRLSLGTNDAQSAYYLTVHFLFESCEGVIMSVLMVTGQLQIELDFMPGTKARLVRGKTKYAENPTVPSAPGGSGLG